MKSTDPSRSLLNWARTWLGVRLRPPRRLLGRLPRPPHVEVPQGLCCNACNSVGHYPTSIMGIYAAKDRWETSIRPQHPPISLRSLIPLPNSSPDLLSDSTAKMPSPKAELRMVNVIHCAQVVLASAVLGIGLYKMFFSKDRAAARTGRWALSVVSVLARSVLPHCVLNLPLPRSHTGR